MADENDCRAGLLEPANDAKELFGFARRKRCRWLIHQENARAMRKRGVQLDHLLIGDGKSANAAPRIQLYAKRAQNRLGALIHRAGVQNPGSLMLEINVFGYLQ